MKTFLKKIYKYAIFLNSCNIMKFMTWDLFNIFHLANAAHPLSARSCSKSQ